ncbi:MAG TPA: hypothetical protein VM658_12305, partial [bacterium]|nr:hypothetical protein [bacterium]
RQGSPSKTGCFLAASLGKSRIALTPTCLADLLTGTPRKIKLPGGRLENLIKTSPLAFLASWRFSGPFILDSTDYE